MIIDLHQDLYSHQSRPDSFFVKDQTSIDQLRDADVRLLFTTGELHNRSDLKTQVDQQLDYYRSFPDWIMIKKSSDVVECLESRKRGFVYHIEGLSALDDLSPSLVIESLDWLYEQGARSLALTHAIANSFAGGNESSGELTEKGCAVIDWVISKDLLFDFAHLNEESFFQVAKIWNRPILFSHGNARGLADTGKQRNLTDEQLQIIANSNGLVGIMFSRNYIKVSRDVVIDDVINQIKYLVDRLGPDKIALGTDFGGCLHEVPIKGLQSIRDLGRLHVQIATTFGHLFADKLFYKNAQKFMLENFKLIA